jgi:methyl-accepting chemotaxis protein
MGNASISQQIKYMTLGLLGVIAVAAVVSLLVMLQMRTAVHRLTSMTEQTELTALALEDLLEARLSALKYRITSDDAFAKTIARTATDAIAELGALTGMLPADDPVLPEISMAKAGIADYARNFGDLSGIQGRAQDIYKRVYEQGTSALLSLTRVFDSEEVQGDAGALRLAGLAQRDFTLLRLYGERFLRDADAEDLDRSAALVASAGDRLTALLARVPGPGLRAGIEEASAGIAAYRTSLDQLVAMAASRSKLAAEMDQIGPATQRHLETLLEAIAVRKDEISLHSERTVSWSLLVIGMITIASIVSGSYASARFRRGIEEQMETSMRTMSALADGDLDVEIVHTDRATEIGRIARALVRFRDKAVEARELESQARAQEEDQRRRKAEEAERRREEEMKAAERIEMARRKILAELGTSIGEVVRAAADGDFSRRIEAEFEDAELRDMVAMINLMTENVESGIGETADVIAKLATGDLTQRMSGAYRGKFAELSKSVNEMSARLSELVIEISEQCQQVAAAAQSMADQSNELQGRVEQQAASLEETAAAMEQISATVRSSAENSSAASRHASSTARKAAEAGKVVESAVSAMGEISEASSKIEDIVAVIDGISFQTSLLALNAGVEAARAGESGRGFAVVASEVRALALRSSEASKDIQALISLSSERIGKGVELVEATGQTLLEVVGEVEDMSGRMKTLEGATTEQATGVGEVTGAINQLDGITQENARLADMGNVTSKEVASQVRKMLTLLSSFTTEERRHESLQLAEAG